MNIGSQLMHALVGSGCRGVSIIRKEIANRLCLSLSPTETQLSTADLENKLSVHGAIQVPF